MASEKKKRNQRENSQQKNLGRNNERGSNFRHERL